MREWFRNEAAVRSLDVDEDRNGNLWAWWGDPAPGSFVTGSHLDSVPDGGAFDGPLGIVSALSAIDLLRTEGFSPKKSIAICVFNEEEGARFGVSCLGSRLLCGEMSPGRALELRDSDGVSLAEAMRFAGRNPSIMGRDAEALSRIGTFVELHIEQGRKLVDLDSAVGGASSIWPHGRWKLDFTGRSDHAGTTAFEDRRDPTLAYAETTLSVRNEAELAGALSTIGRVEITPNGTNAIPSHVSAWLDTRAADEETVRELVRAIEGRAHEHGVASGINVTMTQESYSARVDFDQTTQTVISAAIARAGVKARGTSLSPNLEGVHILETGAGHDAGVLSAHVPTGMLFVRNPTGISHSPEEFAESEDCYAGVRALAEVMASYTRDGDL